jgi:hypothetical protein
MLRLLVTSFLVAGVSLCCCQAHLISGILAGGPSPCPSTGEASGSCCAHAGEGTGEGRAPADDDASRCCGVCCLKWIDKGGSAPMPAPQAQPLALVLAAPGLPPQASPPPHDATRRWAAGPPTLLRLHCALLV